MPEFDFIAYINSVSREQLVTLVLKFAPDSYREQMRNLNLDAENAKKTFEKITRQIEQLFEDEELLNEPADFEASIVEYGEKLSAFWARFPEETGDIFLHCLKRIDDIEEEGLLYNHYRDRSYDGDSFLEIIQRYAASLPFQEKTQFVLKLERLLESFSHSSFYSYESGLNIIFSDVEIPALKSLFMERVAKNDTPYQHFYYRFLSDALDDEEKEYVLSRIYHMDKSLSLELVDTLVQLQKPLEAIRFLEELRRANPDSRTFSESLFIRLIELKAAGGSTIKADLYSGIKTYGTHTLLSKAIQLIPEHKPELELILESVSHYYYLKYLIGINRIDEAHKLVIDSKKLDEHSIHQFFTAYFKDYPEDASRYFSQLIDRELDYTGDRHYESIIDSLQYLLKVDPTKAAQIVVMIRTDYKRRRNLIAMLDNLKSHTF
ncbi:MAG: hypothetical protein ACI9UV_002163 [Algoriphagus sp.]|jgi:hypothetical protein